MTKKEIKDGKKTEKNGKDPANGRFLPGNKMSKGRAPGSRKEKSFLEFYHLIVADIAKENGMDEEEVKKILYRVGYKMAQQGDFRFYKEILDRIHGKVEDKVKHSGAVAFGDLEAMSNQELLDEIENEENQ